jgi:elongation factor P--(R)-beta-lysine ligase
MEHRSRATAQTLIARADLLRSLRAFFDTQGFTEVQPPVLGSEFVIDRHIDPITASHPNMQTGANSIWYLQSSPEAAMKRLIASTGLPQIYSIGPVFRAAEFGRLHNPEFTMLEWYRVGDELDQISNFIERLLQQLLNTRPMIRTTYADAFAAITGLALFDCSIEDFANIAKRFKVGVADNYSCDWDDWTHLLFSEVLQPRLGRNGPELVTHFPASQAALAKLDAADSRVAERFELFIDGIELANGYCELLDGDELLRRSEEENRLRIADGKSPLPRPMKLIDAMRSGLPAMSGCALGFDRLVGIALGKSKLEEVICFPFDLA